MESAISASYIKESEFKVVKSLLGFVKFLGSLKMTVFLLIYSVLIVFFGTLAQVNLGIFQAQKIIFESFWVWLPVGQNQIKIPVSPGGLSLCLLWILNFILVYKSRLHFKWSRLGIFLMHGGFLILVAGGLLTIYFQQESQMTLREGSSTNYSESYRNFELVFTDTSQLSEDIVHAVPQSFLRPGTTIKNENLPCDIKVESFYINTLLRRKSEALLAEIPPVASKITHGIGSQINFWPIPAEVRENRMNIPGAVLTFSKNGQKLGTWFISSGLMAPQRLQIEGKLYDIKIRRERYYYPFTLKLLDFKHDRYPGTDIPFNFSSQLLLTESKDDKGRDVLIYMNNPLRLMGSTFFQASFAENDTVSILQVVKNPAWLFPYVSSLLMALGLMIHFLMNLSRFLKKKRALA